ncbi:Prephenate dehydratase-domain-containing protein [Mycena galericulata]|nr:Prephenate dehydratase-domain-containing protein [Mycena galericulata]
MHEDPKRFERFTVAFLGPLGTYTHQAAYDRFGSTANVFNAVSAKTAHAGVVPQENSIFGSVIETYDALRGPNVGFVRGEILLEVQHCMLVGRGVKREDIRFIKSHEQALGQCGRFLAENFPSASLEKVTSTAAAAQAVIASQNAAAICSKLCATIFDGLEILFEGIQNRKSMFSPPNFTRFYVLSATPVAELPPWPFPVLGLPRCLVRLSSRHETTSTSPGPALTQILAALAMTVSRIDRRPYLDSEVLFHNVYFVELERGDGPISDIHRAIERVGTLGWNAHLLGIW